MQELIVKQQIVIEANSAQVWKTLTTPELTKKYFYGCEMHSTFTPGSPIVFRRKILWFKFELKGQIIKAEPEKLLEYTLNNRRTTGHSHVTINLLSQGAKTQVSISDDVGPEDGADKRYRRSVKAWDKILTGLKRTAEQK